MDKQAPPLGNLTRSEVPTDKPLPTPKITPAKELVFSAPGVGNAMPKLDLTNVGQPARDALAIDNAVRSDATPVPVFQSVNSRPEVPISDVGLKQLAGDESTPFDYTGFGSGTVGNAQTTVNPTAGVAKFNGEFGNYIEDPLAFKGASDIVIANSRPTNQFSYSQGLTQSQVNSRNFFNGMQTWRQVLEPVQLPALQWTPQELNKNVAGGFSPTAETKGPLSWLVDGQQKDFNPLAGEFGGQGGGILGGVGWLFSRLMPTTYVKGVAMDVARSGAAIYEGGSAGLTELFKSGDFGKAGDSGFNAMSENYYANAPQVRGLTQQTIFGNKDLGDEFSQSYTLAAIAGMNDLSWSGEGNNPLIHGDHAYGVVSKGSNFNPFGMRDPVRSTFKTGALEAKERQQGAWFGHGYDQWFAGAGGLGLDILLDGRIDKAVLGALGKVTASTKAANKVAQTANRTSTADGIAALRSPANNPARYIPSPAGALVHVPVPTRVVPDITQMIPKASPAKPGAIVPVSKPSRGITQVVQGEFVEDTSAIVLQRIRKPVYHDPLANRYLPAGTDPFATQSSRAYVPEAGVGIDFSAGGAIVPVSGTKSQMVPAVLGVGGKPGGLPLNPQVRDGRVFIAGTKDTPSVTVWDDVTQSFVTNSGEGTSVKRVLDAPGYVPPANRPVKAPNSATGTNTPEPTVPRPQEPVSGLRDDVSTPSEWDIDPVTGEFTRRKLPDVGVTAAKPVEIDDDLWSAALREQEAIDATLRANDDALDGMISTTTRISDELPVIVPKDTPNFTIQPTKVVDPDILSTHLADEVTGVFVNAAEASNVTARRSAGGIITREDQVAEGIITPGSGTKQPVITTGTKVDELSTPFKDTKSKAPKTYSDLADEANALPQPTKYSAPVSTLPRKVDIPVREIEYVTAEAISPSVSSADIVRRLTSGDDIPGATYNTRQVERQQRSIASLVSLARQVTLPNGVRVLSDNVKDVSVMKFGRLQKHVDAAIIASGLNPSSTEAASIRRLFDRNGKPLPTNLSPDFSVEVAGRTVTSPASYVKPATQVSEGNVTWTGRAARFSETFPLSDDYAIGVKVKYDEELKRIVPVDGQDMKLIPAVRTEPVITRSTMMDLPVPDRQAVLSKSYKDGFDVPAQAVQDTVAPNLLTDIQAAKSYAVANLPKDSTPPRMDRAARQALSDHADIVEDLAYTRSSITDVSTQLTDVETTLNQYLKKVDELPDIGVGPLTDDVPFSSLIKRDLPQSKLADLEDIIIPDTGVTRLDNSVPIVTQEGVERFSLVAGKPNSVNGIDISNVMIVTREQLPYAMRQVDTFADDFSGLVHDGSKMPQVLDVESILSKTSTSSAKFSTGELQSLFERGSFLTPVVRRTSDEGVDAVYEVLAGSRYVDAYKDAIKASGDTLVDRMGVIILPAAKSSDEVVTELPLFFHGTRVQDLHLTGLDPLQGATRSEYGTGVWVTTSQDIATSAAGRSVPANSVPNVNRTFSDRGYIHEISGDSLDDTNIVQASDLLDMHVKAEIYAVSSINPEVFTDVVPYGGRLMDDIVELLNQPSITNGEFFGKVDELVYNAAKKELNTVPDELELTYVQRVVTQMFSNSGVQGITNGTNTVLYDTNMLSSKFVHDVTDIVGDSSDDVVGALHNVNLLQRSLDAEPNSKLLQVQLAEAKAVAASKVRDSLADELESLMSTQNKQVSDLITQDIKLTTLAKQQKSEELIRATKRVEDTRDSFSKELNKTWDGPCL